MSSFLLDLMVSLNQFLLRKDNRPPAAESRPSVTPDSTPHENKATDTGKYLSLLS
jgi:hypothetical protein